MGSCKVQERKMKRTVGIQMSNHYVVYMKLTQYCMSSIIEKEKKNCGNWNKLERVGNSNIFGICEAELEKWVG